MANEPKMVRVLPDYMEEAFKRGEAVIVQNEGKFTRRDDVPERFWQEVPTQPSSPTVGTSTGGKGGE